MLADKFKFVHKDETDFIFNAVLSDDGINYIVSWESDYSNFIEGFVEAGSTEYSVSWAKEIVDNGDWIIVE